MKNDVLDETVPKTTVLDPAKAYQFWLDSPIFSTKRPSKDNYDFGDAATVGKHLKRVGHSIHHLNTYDFAIYLGEHKGEGWIVGIKNFDLTKNNLVGYEKFESLSELKQCWQLD